VLLLKLLALAAPVAALHLVTVTPSAAQPSATAPSSGIRLVSAARQERIGPSHLRYSGGVEVELAADGMRLSADVIDVHLDRHQLLAAGNVVFVTRTSRIAADRADVDTRSQTGTFTNAFGSATVPDTVDRSFFGTQEPDAFFYGATIEKLGPDRYRVHRGGFTTCVQPTPRWEMTAESVTLTVDRRAVLTHAVLKVKDVPLFYLPAVYYPINKEDRATGFLLPVYGTSRLRGPSVGNAFFWAVDRSQDLTVFHDWFTRAGHGYGAEYRYAAAAASRGEVRAYRLQQREVTLGTEVAPAIDSLDVRASVSQALAGGFRARVNVDYTGDMLARQLAQQDPVSATSPTRGFTANIGGVLGRGNSLSVTTARRETFSGTETSWLTGTLPRVQFTRALTRLGRLPVYVAATADYATLVREDRAGESASERGLSRVDASPSIQIPLTPWPFLSIRSSIAWHGTWWSESLVAGTQADRPFFRSYADLRTTITGPTLSRVWNTPGSGYAERLKHVVEPEIAIERITSFDGRDRIVLLEGGDYVYGGTTRVTYGLINRLLARRRTPVSGGVQAREILSVQLQQSAYSDPLASTVDGDYSGGFSDRPAADLSPLALSARATPSDAVQGSLRLEYDTEQGFLETVQASATVAGGRGWSTTAGWTQRRYVENVLEPGVRAPDGFFSSQTRATFARGRVGGSWQIDWNATEKRLVQQKVGAFYHAQCCGFGVEYQAFDFGATTALPVRRDRRFNLSITLAGLGTVSNLLGAFGVGQGVLGGR
jgi:hypothetical protein